MQPVGSGGPIKNPPFDQLHRFVHILSQVVCIGMILIGKTRFFCFWQEYRYLTLISDRVPKVDFFHGNIFHFCIHLKVFDDLDYIIRDGNRFCAINNNL